MALSGPAYLGLVRERTASIDNIQHMQDDAIGHGATWSASQISVRIEILEGYWQRFQSTQRQLALEHSDVEIIADSLNETEQTTMRLYANAKGQLQQLNVQLQSLAPPPSKAPRMADIKLSTFSGNYTEWAAWRSEFKATVLDTTLSVSNKITLLLGALAKEAASCAGRVERHDELELKRVWSKLDKTYDNQYQQVYAHIAKITQLRPLTQPSPERLRSMIDTIDQHLRMLQRFNIETQHWSPIVCVILLDKLDPETRNQWESKDSLPARPELNALFAFLEQRILAIRNVELSTKRIQQANAPSNSTAQKFAKSSSETTNRFHPYDRKQHTNTAATDATKIKGEMPDCPQCGKGIQHRLWKCDTFRALSSTDQSAQIKKWGICEICLVSTHKASECTKGACPICKNGRHNSLICPEASSKVTHHARIKRRPRKSNTNA